MELLIGHENRFIYPKMIEKVVHMAVSLDHILPVDPAHNVKNHGMPVALNIVNFAKIFDPQANITLDNLVIAGLLHDRQRFVVGHVPFNLITKTVLKNSGMARDDQTETLFLIHNHSDLRRGATEKEIYLYIADKKEYFSVRRLENSIGSLPQFAIDMYKRHWKKRVDKIMHNVEDLDRNGFSGIHKIFKEDFKKLKEHISTNRPQMADLFDGITI